MLRSLCVSYLAAALSAVVSSFADGSWEVAPLVRAEEVGIDRIPVDPDEAALRLVDGAIREIPCLLLDDRTVRRMLLLPTALASCTPVLVVHDRWFRSFHALVVTASALAMDARCARGRTAQTYTRVKTKDSVLQNNFKEAVAAYKSFKPAGNAFTPKKVAAPAARAGT
ncbi:hypothetical protein B484DRAFT_410049 [Ochromonadaceae sp. CCMP2298]|nr:hypothetical protein B484DRAFT_410049 [Ochromonadaceae sp. CCMP2298]